VRGGLVVSADGRGGAASRCAGEIASAVLLVVAGVGSAADLAPGEPRRRLLLVWRLGLVAAGRAGRACRPAVAPASPDAAAAMRAGLGPI
jgi:hypothetical protein